MKHETGADRMSLSNFFIIIFLLNSDGQKLTEKWYYKLTNHLTICSYM